MDALYRQVLHHDARQQRQHRHLAKRQQPPGTQQQQQPDAGSQVAQALVGQPAKPVGGIGARRSRQPEQADGGIAERIRRTGQQEGQRRPQHAERGEQQKAQQRSGAKQRLFDEHAQDRTQQAGVAHRRRTLIAGQHAPKNGGHDQHQDGGHPVHRAPTAQVGQRAGNGAGQQNTQQQAAHDGAHGLASLMRRGQGRRERHQNLGDDGQQARQRGAHQQHDDVVGKGRNQQPACGQ
ncbi:hypothetical protein D3C72_1277710 [compost metagenome]